MANSGLALALPRLRQDQWDIINHPAKRKYLSMGRRWGKTVLGGVIVLNVLRQHGKAAWVVPYYKNARALWRYVNNVCAPLAQSKLLDVSRSEKVVTTPRGGFLGIYSADNIDAARSEDFDVAVFDESARIDVEQKQDVFEATLADRDGDAVDISSPKGRNGFFIEWLNAYQDETGYSHAWTAPTNANPLPNIRKAFDRLQSRVDRGEYPARSFKQEWLAEFIDDGAFFSNVMVCANAEAQTTAIDGHAYAIVVDWARASGGDNSVFTVIDATEKSVAHITRLNGRSFDYQLSMLKSVWERFNQCPILAEYNALGMKPVEDLQHAGLPVTAFTTTAQSKHEIMTSLALAFEKKEIKILNDVTLTGELQAFEIKERAGLPAYSAPDGMHDDYVMSLAFAWHQAFGGENWLLA
jgi:hypothetical protein